MVVTKPKPGSPSLISATEIEKIVWYTLIDHLK